MSDVVLARTDVPVQFEQQMHMARVLAESSLLPGHLRGKPANVLIILQGARALDVPAFWALQSMHVIEGKLSMAAELMRALVIRAGHQFRIVERTRERAVVEIHRKDRDQPYRFEYDRQDADDARLLKKDNWQKHLKAMLVARATSGAVRDECPDVLFGVVYTPDELGVVTDADGNPDLIEGKIVQVPTPERVEELAVALGQVELDDFTAAWQSVVDLGWVLEKVPGADDMTLVDIAAEVLRELAREAADTVTVKTIWKIGNHCGLMEVPVKIDPDPENSEVVLLGNYLKARGAFIAEREKAAAETAGSDEPAEGEIVEEEPKITAEEVDTENARELRNAAEASWEAGR